MSEQFPLPTQTVPDYERALKALDSVDGASAQRLEVMFAFGASEGRRWMLEHLLSLFAQNPDACPVSIVRGMYRCRRDLIGEMEEFAKREQTI